MIQEARRFHRLLKEQMAGTPVAPMKVLVRDGQGLNVLLYTSKDHVLQAVITPLNMGAGGAYKSQVAVMAAMGDPVLSKEEEEWMRLLHAGMERLDDDPEWLPVLEWAMTRPGISVKSRSEAGKQTSGDELIIRIIEQCNAACDFCGCIGTSSDYATNLENVGARLAEGYEQGIRRVAFTGGEPTLVKGLPDYVRLAKEMGFSWVNLQTNGVHLANGALTQGLADAGLDSLLLSLHSHIPEVHDRILKLEGAFVAAVEGLKNAVKSGIQVGLNYVVNRENVDFLPGYMEFVCSVFNGIETEGSRNPITVTLSYVSPVGWTLEHLDLIPKISESAPKLAKALDMAQEWGVEVHVPGLCGVPICTLPGYEEYFDEYHETDPPKLVTRDYVEACGECPYRDRCSGYWTQYYELYGKEEFGYTEELPAWAIKENVISPAEINAALAEILCDLGVETDVFPGSLPIPDLTEGLNRRGVPMLKGGKWTQGKCQEYCEEQGLPLTYGPRKPLPSWAKARRFDATPEQIQQVREHLLALAPNPQSHFEIPYLALAHSLESAGVSAPDGRPWTAGYCAEFRLNHGLKEPGGAPLLLSIPGVDNKTDAGRAWEVVRAGWILDGSVDRNGVQLWFRLETGACVPLRAALPPNHYTILGPLAPLKSLAKSLEPEPHIDEVILVEESPTGEVPRLEIESGRSRKGERLIREGVSNGEHLTLVGESWGPLERYLYGHHGVHPARKVQATFNREGILVSLEPLEGEDSGLVSWRRVEVTLTGSESGIESAEMNSGELRTFGGDEGDILDSLAAYIQEKDPDVIRVSGTGVEWLASRWKAVQPTGSPHRAYGERVRRVRRWRDWFPGRIALHGKDWQSPDAFLEAWQNSETLPGVLARLTSEPLDPTSSQR